MPPVLQGTQAIEEIAQIYLHGDKDCALPKHVLSILEDRAKFVKCSSVSKPRMFTCLFCCSKTLDNKCYKQLVASG